MSNTIWEIDRWAEPQAGDMVRLSTADDDSREVWAFKRRLRELGLEMCEYSHTDDGWDYYTLTPY